MYMAINSQDQCQDDMGLHVELCNIILHHQTFVFSYFDGKELSSIGVDDELP